MPKKRNGNRKGKTNREHHHSYSQVLGLGLLLGQQQLPRQSATVASATATSTAATSAASATLTASTTSAASNSAFTPSFSSSIANPKYPSNPIYSGKDTKWTSKNLISSSTTITSSNAPSSAATATASMLMPIASIPPSAEKLKFEEEFRKIYNELPIQKSITGSELRVSIEHKVHSAVARGLMFDNYLREMLTAFQYKTGRCSHVKEYGAYDATTGKFRTDFDAAVESFRAAFEALSKINTLVFGKPALEERDLRFSLKEPNTFPDLSLLDRFIRCINYATTLHYGDSECTNSNLLHGYYLPDPKDEKNKINRYLTSPLWASHHKMLRILIAGGFHGELISRVKNGESANPTQSDYSSKVPKAVMDAIMHPENPQFQTNMVTEQGTNSANTAARPSVRANRPAKNNIY